jgi:hypothetical protein
LEEELIAVGLLPYCRSAFRKRKEGNKPTAQ